MENEQVLKIMATDSGAVKDFDAFCKQTGHEILDQNEAEGIYTFFIKKHVSD